MPEDKFSWVDFNFYENWKVQSQSKQSSLVDFDALQVGVGGLTVEEEKTNLALWAIMRSPLFVDANPLTIRKESLDLLKNQKVLEVN